MEHWRTFVLAIFAFLVPNVRAASHCTTGEPCTISDSSLRFLTLGDFGGFPIWPYYSRGQNKVAEAMGDVAQQKDTHFQIELGDNFYFTGVHDDNDKRFKETFEDIYVANSYMHKPWYMLAGNHDHYGNATAQVAYTKKSNRWAFPSLYYKIAYKLADNTLIEILVIDTIVLCGNTLDGDVHMGSWWELITEKHDEQPRGPRFPEKAEEHWTWLENNLRDSKADYLFVAGHYPVYSICSHGPTDCLVQRLRPLLHQYKATAYMCGHDHNVQHIKLTEQDATVHYIVNGASSRAHSNTAHKDDVPVGSLLFHWPTGWNPTGQLGFTDGAFLYTELSAEKGVFEVYTGDGDKVYTAEFDKRQPATENENEETEEQNEVTSSNEEEEENSWWFG